MTIGDLIRELSTLPTEEQFIAALRVLKIADRSPDWYDAIGAWRAYHRQRR
ncbi:MAG TPA: hypothetical protein VGR81_07850 [Candidatus Acidoferrales bacterium]|nr:hypothetical protein [Candidatus Acidoferrales bacterium]